MLKTIGGLHSKYTNDASCVLSMYTTHVLRSLVHLQLPLQQAEEQEAHAENDWGFALKVY